MRGPQILPLIKSVTTNTACLLPGGLFSGCSSTRESTTYQSPSNTPPVPVIDNRLPYERCSEAVRQLHPSFPPNCTLFEEGEVEVVSDIQVEADGYADIWKARSTLDGYSVIQKSHRCHETEDVGPVFKRYHREVSVCSKLSHPNVAPFIGINPTPNHPFSLIFDTAGYLGLREYLDKDPKADKLKLIKGIARGLKHVHDQGIVHGRLCSQNILVSPNGSPCITGFGSSFILSRPDLWSDADDVGFHRGIAPELMGPLERGKHATRITKASDMYAFGMLTWEIFSGKDPFFTDLDASVVCRVLRGGRRSRPDRRVGLPRRVGKVVKACLRNSPSRRMEAWEVMTLLDAEHSNSAWRPSHCISESPTNHPSHSTFHLSFLYSLRSTIHLMGRPPCSMRT